MPGINRVATCTPSPNGDFAALSDRSRFPNSSKTVTRQLAIVGGTISCRPTAGNMLEKRNAWRDDGRWISMTRHRCLGHRCRSHMDFAQFVHGTILLKNDAACLWQKSSCLSYMGLLSPSYSKRLRSSWWSPEQCTCAWVRCFCTFPYTNSVIGQFSSCIPFVNTAMKVLLVLAAACLSGWKNVAYGAFSQSDEGAYLGEHLHSSLCISLCSRC